MDFSSQAKITWCPGCPNFAILAAFKQAMAEMDKAKEINPDNIVVGAGIGCHGKTTDYLNLNTFTGLHGRIIPAATGIKLGNNKLKVIAFSGDGDSYAEGLDHLIHAAKRNTNITLIIHNNETFALTTGQATPPAKKVLKAKQRRMGAWKSPSIRWR